MRAMKRYVSLLCKDDLLKWYVQIEVTESDVEAFEKAEVHDREYMHGRLAIEAARMKGIFGEEEGWGVEVEEDVVVGCEHHALQLQRWENEMAVKMIEINEVSWMEAPVIVEEEEAHVVAINDLLDESPRDVVSDLTSNISEEVIDHTALNEDQRRAYDIVDWHLQQTLAGHQPSQLLMVISGEGGVGKSRTIETIADNFRKRHAIGLLAKGAYTGIAASIIGGKTLHVLAGIPVQGRKRSAQTLKRVREYWKTKKYLVIDEMSMLSRPFFAKLCRDIGSAMEPNDIQSREDIFGGLNIVLVGDFHQFPPVTSWRSVPLYWPCNPLRDQTEEILGRKAYEQFGTVVRLKKQVRVQDVEWNDTLRHVRHGNCRENQIDLIRQLIITNPKCPTTDYSDERWKNAILVTPQHCVRTQWNTAALRKHCANSHHTLYISVASDTVKGEKASLAQQLAIAVHGKRRTRYQEGAGLMKEVELAIGMPVMVTSNIHTDLDLTNGARGEVVGIILHDHFPHATTIRLQQPPQYVLVKFPRTRIPPLEGLAPNVVPIKPITKSFKVKMGSEFLNVSRTQLPLTAAYAFTDYRAQGQTIHPVIIDIGRPPSGELTPFNMYVALSRGISRQEIRLLRDFDDQLLKRHPSEYLRQEDERLAVLDEKTKDMWHTRIESLAA